jgi:hypothetical protein
MGANEADHLVAGHADAVVTHRECAFRGIDLDDDVQVSGVRLEFFVAVGLQSELVQRVGGVRDELAEERVLVRIDRVDHQLE